MVRSYRYLPCLYMPRREKDSLRVNGGAAVLGEQSRTLASNIITLSHTWYVLRSRFSLAGGKTAEHEGILAR